MPNDGNLPSLYEMIRKWVFDHCGVPGLVGLALLAAAISFAIYAYMNWDKVRTRPGIAPIVDYLSQWPIPKADPNRFSVLIAQLGNDVNREQERLTVEALKEFKGTQVLVLDRTIPLEGRVPEEMEERGHEIARRYLKQRRASVLIWGTVLHQGDQTVPKLYWTTSSGGMRKTKRYDAPRIEAQLRLPEVFWSDLAQILQLLVTSRAAEFNAETGHYVADRLSPFIARVRTLLEASAGRSGWNADARGATRVILADALMVLGDQSGKNKYLEEAVAAYREALKERTRDRVPLDWATTQNNLGNALARLGERESGTERLEEAVAAYREALKEWTRHRVPLYWAGTQNNLGIALRAFGERESGTERLEEAVAAFREALKERTRDRVPLYWAGTQNNLGNALAALGERESGTERLEEAVAAFREALAELTRDRVPLDWAGTQNNLGNALRALGERESGTERLEEAVAAYTAALEVFDSARAAHQVEMTKANLTHVHVLLRKRRH